MNYTSLAVLALSVTLAGCNLHGRPTIERKARPVAPDRPAATETVDPDTVVSPGIVEPWDAQVELSAQESGWIAQLLVKEGDVVQPGQLLATLDDAAQRHNVELAQADLAEAEATLARIERGATLEELQQAQADYDAAAARDEFARTAEARMRRLHADGVVSDDERDRATAEARAQAAIAGRASARLVEIKRGARVEDRHAAGARLLAARARLRVMETGLSRRRVVAANAGTVLLSRLHVGEFYTAGAGPLFVLGDMTRLQVRLEVDEIDARVPAPGTACVIYSDAGVRLAEGTIVRLAPKMGRRALPLESPTARADIRVREVFVEVPRTSTLIPNQRVWGHTSRTAGHASERAGAQS
ncbi:MAG: biotin/lipoyl-binding protein [Acidobacteria bacterium]|nr:biotin/lipoyl-binding protein [Acidobacteriota bacterium]